MKCRWKVSSIEDRAEEVSCLRRKAHTELSGCFISSELFLQNNLLGKRRVVHCGVSFSERL